ncbi:hypothetical protein E3P80_00053 [Wallemia ichthyophaga]|nr:hypothetical protein E3P97_00053 [Wallemia ichthyophaga]TIB51544.1 hypothetical protein E3P82_00053 [Wallemia ichthyophaga]TIB57255.1 hypothetical protein E3P80_00053 [Wallemia ichthyophaga]TIB62425.1 hypothetical protein E3P79_00053 [Wallemia ichthyophaga]
MISSSFRKSARAANGNPQLATGPQKWVEKKYSLAAGDLAQLANLLKVDIVRVAVEGNGVDLSSQLVMKLNLDLRGHSFVVERDQLMNMPESVLLCLFPNGLVLSKPPNTSTSEEDESVEDDIYYVDFDPECFRYVIDFFKQAATDFYGTATSPGTIQYHQSLITPSPNGTYDTQWAYELANNPLLTKQAVIVLREELEYFVIPQRDSSARTLENGTPNEALFKLKLDAGHSLHQRQKIFTALQRNVNKENNVAEQHLIDMLCMSGFSRDDKWGYRALEPARCCITSIALVLLNTGIIAGPDKEAKIDNNQMMTAQKLLLFWRKPARKCWWDGIDIDLSRGEEDDDKESQNKVKVWSRRTWTLETSIF